MELSSGSQVHVVITYQLQLQLHAMLVQPLQT